MSNAPDIERMFAYIGVTDGRYREFASNEDPADALSTWALVDSSDAETSGRDAVPHEGIAAAPVQRAEVFEERLAARRPAASPPAAAPPPLMAARPGPMLRSPGSRPPTGMPGSASGNPPPFRQASVPPGSRPPSLAQRVDDPVRRAPPIGRAPSLAPQPRPPSVAPREEERTAFLAPQATVRSPAPDPYRTEIAPAPPPFTPARPAAPATPERTLFSRRAPEPAATPEPAPPSPPAAEGGLNRMFARLGATPKKDEEAPAAGGTPLSRIFRRLS